MLSSYAQRTFSEFFWVAGSRLLSFFRGEELLLASDEIQCLTLLFVALACSLLGVFLVMRKMTLVANALTHTSLFGIVIVYFIQSFFYGSSASLLSFPALILGGLFSALLTTLTIEGMHRLLTVQKDASIGLVFSFYFALGITLLSLLSKQTHLGLELITGNSDAVDMKEMLLTSSIAALTIFSVCVFYRGLKYSTFDPLGAKIGGYHPLAFHTILMSLCGIATIGGMRAVGILPILVLFTLPVLSARLLTHRFTPLLFLSPLLAVFSVVISVALSRHLLTVWGVGLSTSGILTFIAVLIWGSCWGLKSLYAWQLTFSKPLLRISSP